jgi:Trp operon repressor
VIVTNNEIYRLLLNVHAEQRRMSAKIDRIATDVIGAEKLKALDDELAKAADELDAAVHQAQ